MSEQTLLTRTEALRIVESRAQIGSASRLDVQQARLLTEQARGDVAAARTRLDQDRATLTLVVGAQIPEGLLPGSLDDSAIADALPVGLPSDILLDRPDVVAAEFALKAAHANVGVARTAYLPRLSLTGAAGLASPELGALIGDGYSTWSFTPSLSLPLFAGGANRAGVRLSQANLDLAAAQYEKTIQTAFAEVAQALAVRARIDERIAAQSAAVEAAREAERLATARYEAGAGTYLAVLDSSRSLYSAEQGLLTLRLSRMANLAALYRAVGADTRGSE